jgi:hypothetical protein
MLGTYQRTGHESREALDSAPSCIDDRRMRPPWRPFIRPDAPNERIKKASHDRANWAYGRESISDTNALWRQYVILVDLYRYYIDLAWKVSVWYYTALGVSFVYFLGHLNTKHPSYLPLLLLFLSGMSSGLLVIFATTFRHLREMEEWLEYIAQRLRFPGRPHVEFILSFLKLNCILLFLIALACLGLFSFIYMQA